MLVKTRGFPQVDPPREALIIEGPKANRLKQGSQCIIVRHARRSINRRATLGYHGTMTWDYGIGTTSL